MGENPQNDDKLSLLLEYLGYDDHGSVKLSPDNKQEDEILKGILSAIRDHKKFYIQVVKSFDLQNLNGVLVYLYRHLIENGFQVRLLKDLNYATMGADTGKDYVYFITERYLDISDSETMKKLASLMSGHMPGELRGIPIILGLTENSLKLVDKYRSDNNPEFIYSNNSNKNEHSRYIGPGFILLSLTFFITFVGIIVDRPKVIFLSFPLVSWIIFSASIIAILGFILIIIGSLKLPPERATLTAVSVIMIALLELVSIIVQISGFSILPSPDGLHLATTITINSRASPLHYNNAVIIPIIYSILSIFLAFVFFILVWRFSTKFYRGIEIVALLTAVIGEVVSLIVISSGLGGNDLKSLVVYYSGALFMSFYNNISPLMPYPSVLLNTSDFLFPFGKYSVGIFYLMLAATGASNFLFFVAYLSAGFKNYRKIEETSGLKPVIQN